MSEDVRQHSEIIVRNTRYLLVVYDFIVNDMEWRIA